MTQKDGIQEKTEVFRCACSDKHHYIEADHMSMWEEEDGKIKWSDEEISLRFGIDFSDWTEEKYGYNDRFFRTRNFFNRMKWRIKYGYKILIHGEIKLEDYWIPIWEYEEKLHGEEELKNLINWLNSVIKKAHKNYEDRKYQNKK